MTGSHRNDSSIFQKDKYIVHDVPYEIIMHLERGWYCILSAWFTVDSRLVNMKIKVQLEIHLLQMWHLDVSATTYQNNQNIWLLIEYLHHSECFWTCARHRQKKLVLPQCLSLESSVCLLQRLKIWIRRPVASGLTTGDFCCMLGKWEESGSTEIHFKSSGLQHPSMC